MADNRPDETILGSGMANKAAKLLRDRGYQLAVQEAKAQGLKPPTPEEYLKMKKS